MRSLLSNLWWYKKLGIGFNLIQSKCVTFTSYFVHSINASKPQSLCNQFLLYQIVVVHKNWPMLVDNKTNSWEYVCTCKSVWFMIYLLTLSYSISVNQSLILCLAQKCMNIGFKFLKLKNKNKNSNAIRGIMYSAWR